MNVIDALVVTLGMNADNFKKGSKEAQDDLEKTRKQAEKTAADTAHAFDKQATAALTKFKNEALAITGILLGASGIKDWLASTVQANVQTGNLAKGLGMTANELNAWRRAASAAGGDANDMQSAIESTSDALTTFKLAGTMTGPLEMFRALNISAVDAKGNVIDAAEALSRVAGALQGHSPQDQVFMMKRLGFGMGALPMLSEGPGGMQARLAEMHKLGDITEGAAQSSKALNEEWVRLKTSVEAAGSSLEHKFEAPLLNILKTATAISKAIRDVTDGKPGDPANHRRNKEAVYQSSESAWLWDMLFGHKSAPKTVSGKVTDEAGSATPSSRIAGLLSARGWSTAQINGILANLIHESGLNPSAVGDHGLAYGIGQWHPDRQADFAAWSGRSIRGSSLEDQVSFLDYELTQGKEKSAGGKMRASRSADAVAALMSLLHERPAGGMHEALARARTASSLGHDKGRGPQTVHNETHISQITVQTQATDAQGIARGIRGAVASNPLVAQSNGGMR